MTDLAKIRQAQIEAAEDAVIASIPKDLLANLEAANKEFAAKGGCPGCGSKRIAVHYSGCPTGRDDLY